MRGLIPALVVAELERRLSAATKEERPLADYFQLLAGTSTGGLIALGLTAPEPGAPDRARMDGARLVRLYEDEGPRIFGFGWQRLRSLDGWIAPKYSALALRRVLEQQLGSARLSEALREVVVTAYDLTRREPHFFKRWRARQSDERNPRMVEAAMATAAAPTYFPPFPLAGRAFVDGGVFAANPTVAAIAEALKRTGDQPAPLEPHDLLVVSLGTGVHESGFREEQVRGWGRLGWIRPRGGDPPIIDVMLDGESDAADHWAHMLLNHVPGERPPDKADVGHGPRYFRLQTRLESAYALDDARPERLEGLRRAAERLIAERAAELGEIVERLARAGPVSATA